LELRIIRKRNWRHDPHWLELYADGKYAGIVWSQRATLRGTKWGDYSLRYGSGLSSDVVLWVAVRVVDAG